MNVITTSLIAAHVIAGFGALILFWVPVFSRKGGINHRKVGKWYVKLMWVVVISAVLLSIKNMLDDRLIMAAFLGFLAVLTGRPLLLGIEVLNSKRSLSQNYRSVHLWTSSVTCAAGIALILYGIFQSSQLSLLMCVFGTLGILSLRDTYVLFKSNVGSTYNDWLDDHISNMCVTGIAAHTAFLALGANRILAEAFNSNLGVVAWVAPTVIGTIGIAVARRKYSNGKAIA